MASSSSQQRINRNSGFAPPQRSQSMYIPRSGLDEPEILKRRARSTRGGKSRKSTFFSGRSTPKIPQVENSIDLFEKVINALRYLIWFLLKMWKWCINHTICQCVTFTHTLAMLPDVLYFITLLCRKCQTMLLVKGSLNRSSIFRYCAENVKDNIRSSPITVSWNHCKFIVHVV